MKTQELNKIFNDCIKQSYETAGYISEYDKKVKAYSSIALAIAIRGLSDKSIAKEVAEQIVEESSISNSPKVSQIIDKVENELKSQWKLEYDEYGVPVISEEDKQIPERFNAYQEALQDPDVQINIANRDAKNAESVQAEVQPVVNDDKDLTDLYRYLEIFDYNNYPAEIDLLIQQYTQGFLNNVEELKSNGTYAIRPFILNLENAIDSARAEIEGFKAEDWIGEVTLNTWMQSYYNDNSASMEWLHEGNIIGFAEYCRIQVAWAWYDTYTSSYGQDYMLIEFRKYMEDQSLTLEDVNNDNILGLINWIDIANQS